MPERPTFATRYRPLDPPRYLRLPQAPLLSDMPYLAKVQLARRRHFIPDCFSSLPRISYVRSHACRSFAHTKEATSMPKAGAEIVTMRIPVGDSELEVTGPQAFVERRIEAFLARTPKLTAPVRLPQDATTAMPARTHKGTSPAQFLRRAPRRRPWVGSCWPVTSSNAFAVRSRLRRRRFARSSRRPKFSRLATRARQSVRTFARAT